MKTLHIIQSRLSTTNLTTKYYVKCRQIWTNTSKYYIVVLLQSGKTYCIFTHFLDVLSANEAGCEFANIKPLLHRKPCMLCLWSEELFYSLTSLSMLHTVHDVFYTYIIQNRVYLFRKMYIKY